MRVFVAGATGPLGGPLIPGLVAAGPKVTATTRAPGGGARSREAGAEPPRRISARFARRAVDQIANTRGAANEKAGEPRYAGWREGFRARGRG
ncbi:nucleoside-diphosphate-sugar epimerase [Lipingzhangella halophila]|uniref:Nucleoside-diphosphate-sugar epimerase n=1 Tax=Lipingzhangella halophila TaxID=1783352 RepID=A0A7W7W3H2_9ACTN|nr:hypothetical protein [Lipingzhangella halophila]MBB4931725.1 nucleoside-diphosphate-sugar epimerase [Lipingzhangella halophila]